jgi:hypothetical protein
VDDLPGGERVIRDRARFRMRRMANRPIGLVVLGTGCVFWGARCERVTMLSIVELPDRVMMFERMFG